MYWRTHPKTSAAFAVAIVVFIWYIFQIQRTPAPRFKSAANPTCCIIEPLPPLENRDDLGVILNQEGRTVGLEIGVKQGWFSLQILSRWKSCEKYYLLDPWEFQKNYDDAANVEQEKQNQFMQDTIARLDPFKDQIELIRDYSTSAVNKFEDNSLDFVYVDARHDYFSVLEDMELYYPKVRGGGILAGHDYLSMPEGKDWFLKSPDGRVDYARKAVKGAVDEFAAKHGLQVVVTYGSPREEDGLLYPTWYIRKPDCRQEK